MCSLNDYNASYCIIYNALLLLVWKYACVPIVHTYKHTLLFYTKKYTHVQGRLNELMSQIRMQTQIPGSMGGSDERFSVDPLLMDEIKQVRSSNHLSSHCRLSLFFVLSLFLWLCLSCMSGYLFFTCMSGYLFFTDLSFLLSCALTLSFSPILLSLHVSINVLH